MIVQQENHTLKYMRVCVSNRIIIEVSEYRPAYTIRMIALTSVTPSVEYHSQTFLRSASSQLPVHTCYHKPAIACRERKHRETFDHVAQCRV